METLRSRHGLRGTAKGERGGPAKSGARWWSSTPGEAKPQERRGLGHVREQRPAKVTSQPWARTPESRVCPRLRQRVRLRGGPCARAQAAPGWRKPPPRALGHRAGSSSEARAPRRRSRLEVWWGPCGPALPRLLPGVLRVVVGPPPRGAVRSGRQTCRPVVGLPGQIREPAISRCVSQP